MLAPAPPPHGVLSIVTAQRQAESVQAPVEAAQPTPVQLHFLFLFVGELSSVPLSVQPEQA